MKNHKVSRKKVIVLYLCAPQDRNGNPQRGWLVFDAKTGSTVAFIDEGYRGTAALALRFPYCVDIGGVDVSAKTYREHLRASYAVPS